jgi:predicted Mrr-cat superfamily restriction endonuclease
MTEQASTEIKPKNAFIVRVKKGRREAITHGVVGIGWSAVEDMHQLAGISRDHLKDRIKDVYQNLSSRALGNVAGSIERFCSMSVGDYVLMPVAKRFHLGIVKSSINRCNEEWVAGTHLQWQRNVEWLTKGKPIARDVANNVLQKRLKIRQTCVDISKLIPHITQAFEEGKKILFHDRVSSLAKNTVIQAISHLNDGDLEKLIAKLCLTSGAHTARVLPKKDNTSGDADVLAEYMVMVGKEAYSICIVYQAKRHEKITSEYGVKQLVDRIDAWKNEATGEDDDELTPESDVLVYKGCLVTTATSVTAEAQKIANENSIDIITLDELADWILNAGISNLNV